MRSDWKYETARDLVALGSIPFILLVAARVYIADNYQTLAQLGLALGLLFIISLMYKGTRYVVARIVVAAIFLSLFYNEMEFTLMSASVVIASITGAHIYVRHPRVLLSAFLGILASGISWYVISLLPIMNY